MDFGIKGKRATVCLGSKGLGKACALALAGEGVNVTVVALREGPLGPAAEEIRSESAVTVTTASTAFATETGQQSALRLHLQRRGFQYYRSEFSDRWRVKFRNALAFRIVG